MKTVHLFRSAFCLLAACFAWQSAGAQHTLGALAGYGMGSGFELYLQDKAAGDIEDFKKVADEFVEALSERPEIGDVYTEFDTGYPQYWVDTDAAQCELAGLSPADVLSTLAGY